jgi:hypothetical protein
VEREKEEIEVTPEMLHDGIRAFYGELLHWDDADDTERNKALAAAFRAMLGKARLR